MKCVKAKRDMGQDCISVGLLHPISNREQQAYYPDVHKSIMENGMEFPLIGYLTTIEEWDDLAKRNHLVLPPPTNYTPEQIVIQVRGGNKRLRYAREIGYTHIDCYVSTDLDEVAQLMLEQGKWYKTTS